MENEQEHVPPSAVFRHRGAPVHSQFPHRGLRMKGVVPISQTVLYQTSIRLVDEYALDSSTSMHYEVVSKASWRGVCLCGSGLY
jgi:hypothetical protein